VSSGLGVGSGPGIARRARWPRARLTPAARALVRELLEPGESLADASTWADEIRRDNPETALGIM